MARVRMRLLLGLACLIPALAGSRPLSGMKESGEFVICAAPDALPFSVRADPPAGLYLDLGRMVARDLGLALAVRWVPRRDLARRVNCDAVMGAAVLGPATAVGRASWRSVLTMPYMRAGAVLVTRADAGPAAALADFRSRRVAVPSGSWAHKYLDERAIPVWVRFRTDPEIIEAVVRGDADGGIVSTLAAGWYRQRNGVRAIQVLDALLDPAEFEFDVAMNLIDTDQAALERVNAILAARLADGSVEAIGRRYGGYQPPSGARPGTASGQSPRPR